MPPHITTSGKSGASARAGIVTIFCGFMNAGCNYPACSRAGFIKADLKTRLQQASFCE
jgi:hypothetical protein